MIRKSKTIEKAVNVSNQNLKRRKKGCCSTLKYIMTGEIEYNAERKENVEQVNDNENGLVKR